MQFFIQLLSLGYKEQHKERNRNTENAPQMKLYGTITHSWNFYTFFPDLNILEV